MSTISDTFAALDQLRDRLISEDTATSQDIEKAMNTVHKAHQTVTQAIDTAFGTVLRDLQAMKELRQTAILDAIGPIPPQIEGDQPAQLQAAE